MIRLLLDGVAFQSGATPATRLWAPLLTALQRDDRLLLFVLDRGHLPPLTNARPVPFPLLIPTDRPEDSRQIQRFCDHFGIDAFISSGFTTPLTTPMLMVVQDLMPELTDHRAMSAGTEDRATAFACAQRYVCASDGVCADLLTLYPEIPPSHAVVSHPGIDHGTFRVRALAAVDDFRRLHQLPPTYVLYCASEHAGAAERAWMHQVFAQLSGQEDVVRIRHTNAPGPDGQPWPGGADRDLLINGDEERALAYNAALATVHWEPDSVFPLSLVEAMAAGCPAISMNPKRASLRGCPDTVLHVDTPVPGPPGSAEAAGRQLHSAAGSLRHGAPLRGRLQRAGLDCAAQFTWSACARAVADNVMCLVEEARRGDYDAFHAQWSRLRRIQANVDFPV